MVLVRVVIFEVPEGDGDDDDDGRRALGRMYLSGDRVCSGSMGYCQRKTDAHRSDGKAL